MDDLLTLPVVPCGRLQEVQSCAPATEIVGAPAPFPMAAE